MYSLFTLSLKERRHSEGAKRLRNLLLYGMLPLANDARHWQSPPPSHFGNSSKLDCSQFGVGSEGAKRLRNLFQIRVIRGNPKSNILNPLIINNIRISEKYLKKTLKNLRNIAKSYPYMEKRGDIMENEVKMAV